MGLVVGTRIQANDVEDLYEPGNKTGNDNVMMGIAYD